MMATTTVKMIVFLLLISTEAFVITNPRFIFCRPRPLRMAIASEGSDTTALFAEYSDDGYMTKDALKKMPEIADLMVSI